MAGQAADELLSINGIQVAFVLFHQPDAVFISARSIGRVNVQVILEALGGGGNAATAGAQIKGKTVDEVQKALIGILDQYMTT